MSIAICHFIRIKDKINNPPEKKDFQKVSHSLARFIALKESAKADTNNKRKKYTPRRENNEDKPGEWKCNRTLGPNIA